MTTLELGMPSPRLLGVLTEHAALVRRTMALYLERQAPLPYLGSLAREYPERGGRMLGAGLCLVAVRVCGGRLEEALPVAAALELQHNAFLVERDIAERTRRRRGGPTLHRQQGIPLAINTSDVLTLLGLWPFLDRRRAFGSRLSLQILRELEHIGYETARGWAKELDWRQKGVLDPGEEEYFRMALGKVGWPLVIGPMAIGARIVARAGIEPGDFFAFGFLWSSAFQILEDIANLGAGQRPIARDALRRSRSSLPIMRLARHLGPEEKERLARLLAALEEPEGTPDLEWLAERLAAEGCFETAHKTARLLAERAAFEAAGLARRLPPTPERSLLREICDWVACDV